MKPTIIRPLCRSEAILTFLAWVFLDAVREISGKDDMTINDNITFSFHCSSSIVTREDPSPACQPQLPAPVREGATILREIGSSVEKFYVSMPPAELLSGLCLLSDRQGGSINITSSMLPCWKLSVGIVGSTWHMSLPALLSHHSLTTRRSELQRYIRQVRNAFKLRSW